jgi:2-hydroxyglutarate dehydrogenase
VIVGAGIVGLATARELSLRHPGLRIEVLEREPVIGAHQTGRSSGVIHSGIYYAPGSLKARLCTAGAREMYDYCAEHGIEAKRIGKLIVAAREAELPRLEELERRGHENGVPDLRRLDPAGIREIEPHATGLAALHSPFTGVVDFARVARNMAGEVEAAGGSVHLGCAVAGVRDGVVEHAGGATRARATIVCAGAWGDRLAAAAGAPADPRIVPFKGAYLRLRPERDALVRANIYPVPDPELPFLGAHLTRGFDGSVLLGPTALMARSRGHGSALADVRETLGWPGSWRLARKYWRAGALEILHAVSRRALVRSAARLVPELRPADFVSGPFGIRAQALGRDGALVDDFLFARAEGALFVRNAPSPAATSSLPLARMIADEAEPLLTSA